MHAKTHSEVGSLAPSSPDRNRPAYYVQSPSHDGEKTTASVTSTPILSSPVGSPRHSRESSTSAPLKPGSCSRKVSSGSERRDDGFTNWEFDLMEDEEDGEPPDQLPPPCFFFAFFVVVFLLFSLILWGLSKHQKPNITMQSIKFERFTVQAGSDSSGVSTDMISLNSTLNFKYRNTATFFGVHVSSTPVSLSYSQLNIAFGVLQEFYKKRKQEKNVSVVVSGDNIPMYGNGASLTTPTGMSEFPVTLKLEVSVGSRAHVLGKLVKQRFYNKVECFLDFAITKIDLPISLNNCTYHRS
ncbi:uncharacterized protein LOC131010818 isoform X1 [Salvia miltiorrhiza]|uniref:uncharacterized protein LOC131010818 isoform X1 n=1 Tax=Salvia miltiorrhiza TaxID=226208 RepID=UPI0025AD9660|nr:uncharacterized protein LOC131010818 isoform X1 [Salvia miltiorrhiza]